ncbi:F0F1 ATP synthase subunit B [Streptococcus cameli]
MIALNASSAILGNFILVTASFLILLVLIRVFAWNKITGIFEERAQKIAGELDAAEAQHQAATDLVKEKELELAKGRQEGKRIVQDAVERAKVEKKHIVDQATVEAKALKEKAKLEIAAEKKEAQENLKIQVANLAVDLAGKIILTDLSEEDHRQLIDRYLDRLGES